MTLNYLIMSLQSCYVASASFVSFILLLQIISVNFASVAETVNYVCLSKSLYAGLVLSPLVHSVGSAALEMGLLQSLYTFM